MSKYKYIALLTDFGVEDNFVGVMKGVMLSINPDLKIIDITHNISPQSIIEASFLLRNSYKYFPENSIFLCVVDPGVGTQRDIIILKKNKNIFIAPDNGLLSPLLELEKENKLYKLKIPNKYIPLPQSVTFHGRDIFAPLAAFISKGINLKKIAISTNKINKLEFPHIQKQKNILKGEIIYIDRFGNCISNISEKDFLNFIKSHKFLIKIKNIKIKIISKNYQINKKYGAIFNSFNLLEIFVPNGNAAKKLNIKLHQKIIIKNLDYS